MYKRFVETESHGAGAERGDYKPSHLYFIPPRFKVREREGLNVAVFNARECSTNVEKKDEIEETL